jgi:tRNA-dihydrouridine synthase C
MRLGCHNTHNAIDCARAFESAGMQEIVVHGRTKIQGYRPPAYWDEIGKIRAAVTLNVVANGEIWTVEDYHRCRDESSCRDVMLGRGIVRNPALALLIRAERDHALAWQEVQPLLRQFWRQVQADIERRHQPGRLKQWLTFLRQQYPEAQMLFEQIRTLTDPIVISALLQPERQAA